MLDRKRSYGTISGVSSIPGAKFDQDGKLFNMMGEELDAEGKVVHEPKPLQIKDPVVQSAPLPHQEPVKMRLHELAKKAGIPNKDMIDRLRAMGVDVGTHMSTIDDADVERVLTQFPKKLVIGGGDQ